MTLDKALRNTLRNTVTQCRRLLEEAVGDVLEGRLGIGRDGQVEDEGRMGHLSESEMEHRQEVISHLRHIEAGDFKPADAAAQLIREVAYTHLNRLCAYKMLERRRLIREAVGRGLDSNGFKFYLADHPEDEKLWTSGQQDVAYRHFLEWIGGTLSEEIGVLFSPTDPANRLFPPQRTLDAVLALVNGEELTEVWDEEETIGWVYQYYTPKELRDQARKESQAPRNSYELSFRNQFYTPRYVVRFLVDNTLGRTWYEMRQGNTRLTEQCAYLVRRPDEVFLDEDSSLEVSGAQGWLRGESVAEPDVISLGHAVNGYNRTPGPGDAAEEWIEERLLRLTTGSTHEFETQELLDLLFLLCRKDRFVEGTLEELAEEIRILMNAVRERVDLGKQDGPSQEERLRAPVFVPYHAPKDPRELSILDPACGSGHFLLYCFDLLETIYEEAYDDERLGEALREEYPDRDEFRRAMPALILWHNLHGIDIDVRATQIAALALWLRAQRSYGDLSLKGNERPRITRSNIVCAEPMPGEREMLEEFTQSLEPTVLGQLVEVVFDKMKLAGEAGSLLKIEEEIESAIAQARAQWQREFDRATDRRGNELLLTHSEMNQLSSRANTQMGLFDVSQVTDEEFWNRAEEQVIEALRSYSAEAANGKSYLRKLFADDATQGFAFIDTCRTRFDIVLMNPPFGDPSVTTRDYIKATYPESATNLFAGFMLRATAWAPAGTVGAITDSSWLKKGDYGAFRSSLLKTSGMPHLMADLGWGVLDTANVATSAYISSQPPVARNLTVFRATDIDVDNKPSLLMQLVDLATGGDYPDLLETPDSALFLRSWNFFEHFPENALAYETPDVLVKAFETWLPLEPTYAIARRGYTPGDTFRFFRCWWEVPISARNSRWWTLNNGSPYAPILGRGFFVSQYEADWASYQEYSGFRLESEEWFGKPGLGYGKRTDFMYAYPLPARSMFSNEGHCVFPTDDHYWAVLGYLNSLVCQALINLYSVQHKFAGYIAKVPTPDLDSPTMVKVGEIAELLWSHNQQFVTRDETSEHFEALFYVDKETSFSSLAEAARRADQDYRRQLNQIDVQVLGFLSPSTQEDEAVRQLVVGRPSPSLSVSAPILGDLTKGTLHPADLLHSPYAGGRV